MNAEHPGRGYLETRVMGTITVVRFTPPALVGEEAIEAVGRQLFSLGENGRTGCLLLNFEGIESLGSALLGKLITLNKQMTATGGRLVLCRIAPYLYEKIFEIHRLSKLFAVYDDEPAALLAISSLC